MSNSRYNYYDPEFNPEETYGNMLLIMVCRETFSFAVIQVESNKVLVWGEQYSIAELSAPNALKSILTASYNTVKVGIQTTGFTMVPAALYSHANVAQYAQFIDKQATDAVLVNKLDADNFVVFKVDAGLAEAISQHFDVEAVYFAGKAWISAVNFARPYNQPLYVNVCGNIMQMLHFADGKTRFYNSFEFNNADELMYFTILTANELDLNLDATSVILSGDISLSDKKIQRLNDLLPKVYFNQNHVVDLPDGFMQHQILMLAGLSLCESLVAG